MNEIFTMITCQYVYQYEKYGVQPTRIILGVEVAREAVTRLASFAQDPLSGKITCFGVPVTVDYQNPRLIHVTSGEDYMVELEGE